MIKNYIKIAWRNIRKHRLFAMLNILCLSLGLTFALLIGVYIIREMNIDANLNKVEDQYVLKSNWKTKDMGLDITTVNSLPKALREEYPNLVANYYRNVPVTNVISADNKYFKEEVAIGDTSFVRMFGFSLLHGDPQHPFINNSSAVITGSMARKLFGTTNAIGKTINMGTTVKDTQQSYTVSAVLKTPEYNSVMNLIGDAYEVFVPAQANRYFANNLEPAEGWDQFSILGFVQLQPHVTSAQLNKAIKSLLKKHAPDWVQNNLTVEPNALKFYYLNEGSKKKMTWSLGLVALFILVMGVANYINISIGIASGRLKEIGLRKVFGVEKRKLVLQFITESIVLALLAGIVAVVAYEVLHVYFGNLLNMQLPHFWQFGREAIIYGILLIFFVAFVAGIYPAFVLSKSKTILAVKGKGLNAKAGSAQRKVLVGLQFTLAIVVFIAAVTIARQMKYTLNKDLGYNRDQLLVITAFPKQWDAEGVKKMENIRNGLKGLSSVKNASLSFEVPDRKPPNAIELTNVGKEQKKVFLPATIADNDYANTLGMKMVAGSFFSQGGSYIPNQLVINETALHLLDLTPENAIGKTLDVQNGAPLTNMRCGEGL